MAQPLTTAARRPAHDRAPGVSPANAIAARWPVLVAALLGLTLLFGVGLAHPHVLHNAAHDARHAGGFPCH